VVRINGAPTANFVSDVGNRTDMRALSKAFTRRCAIPGDMNAPLSLFLAPSPASHLTPGCLRARYALATGAAREVGALPLEWGTTLLTMGVHVDEYNELVDALQVSKSIALVPYPCGAGFAIKSYHDISWHWKSTTSQKRGLPANSRYFHFSLCEMSFGRKNYSSPQVPKRPLFRYRVDKASSRQPPMGRAGSPKDNPNPPSTNLSN
jgi:hypothetical protein